MSYHGHTCKLPWMERPMGPCPACEYAREMQELGDRAEKIRQFVREQAVAPIGTPPEDTTRDE